MKNFSGALCIILLLVGACKKENSIAANQLDLNASYQKFLDFKSVSGNSYTYTTTSVYISGVYETTIITVLNGEIFSRSFKQSGSNANGQPGVINASWTEDQFAIGSHQQGSPALTLDQVYDKAKNVWLKVDSKANTLYFETGDKGLMKTAGYTPKNCADDCFTGINIVSIIAAH